MTLPDWEARREQEREARRQQKHLAAKVREDVQAVMNTASGRRLVWGFLCVAGVDASGFSENATAMAFAAGWRDAGLWWLAAIRDHCPEKEAQMRAEANREAREGKKEPDGSEHDDE